ncbi:LysR family transcriptional regulator [Kiloniella sp. b19]|uniref:LysR family transcriptional regulator n=1 Tax=Kiloniella sp. GXU_MW_B19 TaxID=3141326 RepID=UPI0031DBAC02
MNITIRQLQAFREVMQTGSISEAARTLGRTQPAVSHMIASLEEELGTPLFERQRGRLFPMPEANFFSSETEAILQQLSSTCKVMSDMGRLQEGRLRIVSMPASSQFFFPRLIADFVKDKPKVQVSLMMRTSSTIQKWIAAQQFDIGLAETPYPDPALLVRNFNLRCVCAVTRDDPLSDREVITAADLSGRPMALLDEGHPNKLETEAAFKAGKSRLVQRFEVNNFQLALQLAERGLCNTLCDPLTANSYREYNRAEPRLVFKPFEPSVSLAVSLLQPAHRPASTLVSAFADKLTAELEGLEEPV